MPGTCGHTLWKPTAQVALEGFCLSIQFYHNYCTDRTCFGTCTAAGTAFPYLHRPGIGVTCDAACRTSSSAGEVKALLAYCQLEFPRISGFLDLYAPDLWAHSLRVYQGTDRLTGPASLADAIVDMNLDYSRFQIQHLPNIIGMKSKC
jgi:hypothetical protein